MVHQHRIFSSLGKKTSSILSALHDPILVPPVILLDPKISPALHREKGRMVRSLDWLTLCFGTIAATKACTVRKGEWLGV
jgi:hypothetical protein